MIPELKASKSKACVLKLAVFALAACCLLSGCACAAPVEISGQFSVWSTVSDGTQFGARYIPEFSFSRQVSENMEMSVEAALNIYGFTYFGRDNNPGSDAQSDLYRLWVRLASPRLEVRAGLQKISFGPAALLRPLKWFDSLSPSDPLQLTSGVYGLLVRYFFPDNRSIWVWGLYGNDDVKGWENIPSGKSDAEYGFRYQFPVRNGEMAFSYHHRIANPEGTSFQTKFPAQGKFAEDSFGLDGKWDIGPGVWFEGTVTRSDLSVSTPRYRRMLVLGADYTFDVGNGLHLLTEHLFRDDDHEALTSLPGSSVTALTADYPLNLFDTVKAVVYFDHENSGWSGFLQWRRTYDDWQVYIQTFWSREDEAGGELAGDGIQIMFIFNH